MTIDDDYLLYARAFRRRMGPSAVLKARQQMSRLRESGDRDGAEAWQRVAALMAGMDGEEMAGEETARL